MVVIRRMIGDAVGGSPSQQRDQFRADIILPPRSSAVRGKGRLKFGFSINLTVHDRIYSYRSTKGRYKSLFTGVNRGTFRLGMPRGAPPTPHRNIIIYMKH
jgi:hypothetical protein